MNSAAPIFRCLRSAPPASVPLGYRITVAEGVWEGAQLFEARVTELPSVVEYAATAEEAHALAVDAIQTTAAVFAESGRAMPVPQSVAFLPA